MLWSSFAAVALHVCCRCGRRSLRALCKPCLAIPPLRTTTPAGIQVIGLGPHERALRSSIARLKYQNETLWAAHLGAALAIVLPAELREFVLVPVPLFATRLAERGFNQSALLARAVASATGMCTEFSLLHRTAATRAQARLAKVERQTNIKGAFTVLMAREARPMLASGVVLLDDVVTTGATIDSCVEALTGAGIRVRGAVCCAVAGTRVRA